MYEQTSDKNDQTANAAQPATTQKPYSEPQLVVYGDLETLTQVDEYGNPDGEEAFS